MMIVSDSIDGGSTGGNIDLNTYSIDTNTQYNILSPSTTNTITTTITTNIDDDNSRYESRTIFWQVIFLGES